MGLNFKIMNVTVAMTMLCVNISNIVIIIVKGVDYHCIIHDINKYEAIIY